MTKESEALATFLSACIDGEMNGDNMKKAMAEYVQPSVPTWHDAPTGPGLWMGWHNHVHQIEAGDLRKFSLNSGLRWFGPIPEDKP